MIAQRRWLGRRSRSREERMGAAPFVVDPGSHAVAGVGETVGLPGTSPKSVIEAPVLEVDDDDLLDLAEALGGLRRPGDAGQQQEHRERHWRSLVSRAHPACFMAILRSHPAAPDEPMLRASHMIVRRRRSMSSGWPSRRRA